MCGLIDIGEWLHTGSRTSTLATELTETPDRSGKSAERKRKQNTFKFERKSKTISPNHSKSIWLVIHILDCNQFDG